VALDGVRRYLNMKEIEKKSLPPETVFVLIHMADDTVGIMQFVTDDHKVVQREATKENIAAEIERSEFGEGKKPVKSWKVIDPSEIPQDRTFRNAWTHSKGKIVHDMPRAREIHRGRLREARKQLLLELDAAYMKADEAGETVEKQRIAKEKQRLRDVTAHPDTEKAKTVDELKTVWPI